MLNKVLQGVVDMKEEKSCFYEIVVCYSNEDFNGVEKEKPFVLALDNRSNSAYVFTNNKSNNKIVMHLEQAKVMIKKTFIEVCRYSTNSREEWNKFQKNALVKSKVLLVLTNEVHDDEKALVDSLTGRVLLKGDYYHDKIDHLIEGYIEALADCGYYVVKTGTTVSPDEKEFVKLGFTE